MVARPADGSGPLVIAHRGASAALPEHTLAAYLRAIEDGADGLECDIRLTRDGHLICIHDGRLDRTSNGRGRVSRATLDELADLDFGSWHRNRGGGPTLARGAGVLTLDRLISVAASAGRPLRLLIETKHPSRHAAAVELRLVELLHRHGLTGRDPGLPVRVTVMSFSLLAIRRLRQYAPAVDTVYLFELAPPGVRAGRPPFGASQLGPSVAALRAHPTLVRRAHARGVAVYVWTANTPSEVGLAIEVGVDGIITDDPGFVLGRLGRAPGGTRMPGAG